MTATPGLFAPWRTLEDLFASAPVSAHPLLQSHSLPAVVEGETGSSSACPRTGDEVEHKGINGPREAATEQADHDYLPTPSSFMNQPLSANWSSVKALEEISPDPPQVLAKEAASDLAQKSEVDSLSSARSSVANLPVLASVESCEDTPLSAGGKRQTDLEETDGAEEEDEEQTNSRPELRRKRVIKSSATGSSAGESDQEGSLANDVSGDEEDPLTSTSLVELPSSNTVFSSVHDIYLALVQLLVPIYGVSVSGYQVQGNQPYFRCNRSQPHYTNKCPFKLVASRVGSGWALNYSASYTLHNHDPVPAILADPDWRPAVRNAAARAALGMAPLPGKRGGALSASKVAPGAVAKGARNVDGRSKKQAQEGDGVRGLKLERKKRKFIVLSSDDDDGAAGTASARFPRIRTSTQPSPPPEAGPSSSAAAFPPATSGGLQIYPFGPAASTPSAEPLGSNALSVSTSTSFRQPPSPPSSPLEGHLSLEALAAFLTSLSPSLASLAPALFSYGLDTAEHLVSLSLLELEMLERLVELVQTKGASAKGKVREGGRMSVIQGKMLVKGLREAVEGEE